MHRTIEFPNIGIHLSNVGDHITIFGFDIAFYGIIIGIGILVGLFIAIDGAKRTGQNPEIYYDLVIYAVIFSVIGARIYYVAFSWDMYKNDLKSIFNTRQGGLAIYGGIIAAVITVIVFCLDFVFESMNKYGVDKLKNLVQTTEEQIIESKMSIEDTLKKSSLNFNESFNEYVER